MFILIYFFSMFLTPSIAEAWGPLTHVYLGNEVLNLGISVIPPGIYSVIKKFKSDFIYGNLSADIIIGKRFQELKKNTHNWDIAWKLFGAAKTDRQKAFVYGYLTHLSADTVVHNLKNTSLPFKHSFMEVKSDSIIDKKYRKILKGLAKKNVHHRNDVFLEGMLECVFFSFKTNKRIFKGILFLSRVQNYSPLSNFIDKRFPYEIPLMEIYKSQEESLIRMIEVLKNGENSRVLMEHPLGKYRRKAS